MFCSYFGYSFFWVLRTIQTNSSWWIRSNIMDQSEMIVTDDIITDIRRQHYGLIVPIVVGCELNPQPKMDVLIFWHSKALNQKGKKIEKEDILLVSLCSTSKILAFDFLPHLKKNFLLLFCLNSFLLHLIAVNICTKTELSYGE